MHAMKGDCELYKLCLRVVFETQGRVGSERLFLWERKARGQRPRSSITEQGFIRVLVSHLYSALFASLHSKQIPEFATRLFNTLPRIAVCTGADGVPDHMR